MKAIYCFLIQATCYYMLGPESNGLEPDQDRDFFSSDPGPTLFAKLIRRRQNSPLARKELKILVVLTNFLNIAESDLAPTMDVEKMNEQYMSSRQWLEKYGLGARKLELFDVLSGVAFKHKDGVVDVKTHPGNEFQTDAVSSSLPNFLQQTTFRSCHEKTFRISYKVRFKSVCSAV